MKSGNSGNPCRNPHRAARSALALERVTPAGPRRGVGPVASSLPAPCCPARELHESRNPRGGKGRQSSPPKGLSISISFAGVLPHIRRGMTGGNKTPRTPFSGSGPIAGWDHRWHHLAGVVGCRPEGGCPTAEGAGAGRRNDSRLASDCRPWPTVVRRPHLATAGERYVAMGKLVQSVLPEFRPRIAHAAELSEPPSPPNAGGWPHRAKSPRRQPAAGSARVCSGFGWSEDSGKYVPDLISDASRVSGVRHDIIG